MPLEVPLLALPIAVLHRLAFAAGLERLLGVALGLGAVRACLEGRGAGFAGFWWGGVRKGGSEGRKEERGREGVNTWNLRRSGGFYVFAVVLAGLWLI